MGLLSPDPGLVFWSFITFGLLVFILKKYAWKPILHALQVREETIDYSLKAAQKAREEVSSIEAQQAQMLEATKQERDELIKEARVLKNNILDEAKKDAQTEADKIIANARLQILRERDEAIQELKEKVAELSVDIAGKLLEQELETTSRQKAVIDRYLQEVNFN